MFCCEGCNFALYVPVVIQLFGIKNSSSNYGLIASANGIMTAVNIAILSQSRVSFQVACRAMGLLTLGGFFSLYLLKYIVAQKTKEGFIRNQISSTIAVFRKVYTRHH
jgi:hypothetical protein